MGKITFSVKETSKKLAGLNPSKSPGPDKVSPEILKNLAEELAKPLAIIFQTAVETSALPKIWKQANITAIFKKGRKDLPSNYRPVSLTSIPCKVMETLVREQIFNHMKLNGLMSRRQYGFINGRSTTTQLLKVLDMWTEIVDVGGQVDTIFMDFMKAFDKVPHKRLIGKIASYKIEESTVRWLESFLSERIQRVCVNNCLSEALPVTSGIPQGSVLGPTMFIIYINDLPDIVQSEVFLFADDTKIFRQIQSDQDMEILQQDLNALCEWSRKWLLLFHPDKCKLLRIGKKEVETEYTMVDNSGCVVKLGGTTAEKDLGITVDEQLTFEDHIIEKVNIANRNMGIIRRTFQFLDKEMFLNLYCAQVRPHLSTRTQCGSPIKSKTLTLLRKCKEGQQKNCQASRISVMKNACVNLDSLLWPLDDYAET